MRVVKQSLLSLFQIGPMENTNPGPMTSIYQLFRVFFSRKSVYVVDWDVNMHIKQYLLILENVMLEGSPLNKCTFS